MTGRNRLPAEDRAPQTPPSAVINDLGDQLAVALGKVAIFVRSLFQLQHLFESGFIMHPRLLHVVPYEECVEVYPRLTTAAWIKWITGAG